jgi:flagellar biosynthesis chaperone FliJ
MENIGNESRNLKLENAALNLKVKAAKKEGITKGALISGIAAVVFIIAAGVFAYSFYQKDHNRQVAVMNEQMDTFSKQVSARDSVLNEWLITFDQIESDLNLIKQKEKIISVQSTDMELKKNRKEQVLEDIRYINTLLDNNKKKIASLTAQLNNSGTTIKGLQTKLASLETTMKQYESDITGLKENLVQKDFEIGQLNNKMTDLEVTLAGRDEMITDQTNAMNRGYLASGTLKELKNKGIVTREKGFAGLWGKGTLASDMNDSLFARIDVRDMKMIPVNSRNAKLISKHPSNSYSMIHEGNNKISYIEISDPDNFWKFSKYAVVEIIK